MNRRLFAMAAAWICIAASLLSKSDPAPFVAAIFIVEAMEGAA